MGPAADSHVSTDASEGLYHVLHHLVPHLLPPKSLPTAQGHPKAFTRSVLCSLLCSTLLGVETSLLHAISLLSVAINKTTS